MSLFLRILICIACAGLVLYKSVDKINDLTELRLSIPLLEKELRELSETNLELEYQISRFESPEVLLELSLLPEFHHLYYPEKQEIWMLSAQGDHEKL